MAQTCISCILSVLFVFSVLLVCSPSSPSRSPPLGRSYESTVSSLDAFAAGRSFTEKDEKIVELQEKNNDLQRQVLELEDSVRAKDELIRARTEAVALMSADLSARGKSTLDQLEETRAEMKKMQLTFAEQEAKWREQMGVAKVEVEAKENRIRHLEGETER